MAGRKKLKRRMSLALMWGLILVTPFALTYYYQRSLVERYTLELTHLESNLNSKALIEKVDKYNMAKREYEVLDQYYQIMGHINDQIMDISKVTTDVLEGIETTFPKDIYITQLTSDTKTVHMQGTAADRVVIAEFQHNLKSLNIFEQVHVSIMNQQNPTVDYVSFSMTCQYKGGGEDEVK